MDTKCISHMIQVAAERYGDKPALCLQGGDPDEIYSYHSLNEASGRLAVGFIQLGIKPGDRIALLSESRPRWGLAFFAAVRAGAVVVPLDIRQTDAGRIAAIEDSRPKVLVISASQQESAEKLAAACTVNVQILSIESASSDSEYSSIDAIASSGLRATVVLEPNDAAVLTYTSGTMGTSKGVITTHGNLMYQIRSIRKVMLNDANIRAVSVLPLSHLFELTAGFLGVLHGGGCIRYCNSMLPHEIVTAMREQRVTCMATVPLILKLFADSIRSEIKKQAHWRRAFIKTLMSMSRFLTLTMRRRLFRRLHECFGGQLESFVCGGAPLDKTTLKFFECIGIPVYQGYGLAETSPVIATNGPLANRSGSVGRPLPGVAIEIAADGEILTRGPHVMHGYYGNDELTASVIDAESWLHTGDIGHIDRDGFLFVSGRKKNVIVLGSGKKVQPEELEPVLFEHPFIEEGCVVGVVANTGFMKDSEEVCAIAVASENALRRCAERSEDIVATMRRIIEQKALRLSPGMRPTRFFLRTEPLPRTTTRKICRKDLMQWLSDEGVLT